MAHASPSSVFDFTVQDASGAAHSLAQYRGRPVLIVAVASGCGLASSGYRAAVALHEVLGPRGLVVLGFPCNQFGGMEPGTAVDICNAVTSRHGVKFPVLGKVDVNGPSADPLFAYLTAMQPGWFGTRRILWNFTSFLCDADGLPVARFRPGVPKASIERLASKLLPRPSNSGNITRRPPLNYSPAAPWCFLAFAEVQSVLSAVCLVGLLTFLFMCTDFVIAVGYLVPCLMVAGAIRLQRYIASGMRKPDLTALAEETLARGQSGAPEDLEPMGGQVAIVTGASGGIGLRNAEQLARLGAAVILACRDVPKAEKLAAAITRRYPPARLSVVQLDIAVPESVDSFIAELPSAVGKIVGKQVTALTLAIDVLLNNAGMFSPRQSKSACGLELVMATNVLGPCRLTEGLLPSLRRGNSGKGGRVVLVSSIAHYWAKDLRATADASSVADAMSRGCAADGSYKAPTYGLSKLCNLMYARELAARFAEERRDIVKRNSRSPALSTLAAVSLHPGFVLTDVFRELGFGATLISVFGPLIAKTPEEGSRTSLHCCVAPLASETEAVFAEDGTRSLVNGGHYVDCALANSAVLLLARGGAEVAALHKNVKAEPFGKQNY